MIALIQKMLQLYAAKALQQAGSSTPSAVDQVIAVDEDRWEPVIRQLIKSEQTSESEFSQDLQKRMETALLSQTSGSYTQRVQVTCTDHQHCNLLCYVCSLSLTPSQVCQHCMA